MKAISPPKKKCAYLPPLLLLLLAGFAGSRAYAIIDANSRSNTNPPPDGAPWANVGTVNFAGAVYVGGGWALTATHVGPGTANFGGLNFPWDGRSQRLTNSDGSGTDLVMFHLTTPPSLPRLSLAVAAPAALSLVDLISFGVVAGSAQTNFGLYTGFYWGNSGFENWGNNKVNAGGVTTISGPDGNLSVFTMDFTSPSTIGPTSQTSDEAQAGPGDSGGGVFQLNGSVWELVGVVDAIMDLPNQPTDTAVYGDDTYAADVATYHAQIAAIIASTIPALTITAAGPDVQVCWLDTGVTYNLEATHSLDSPSAWTTLTPSLTSTNGQICALLPATGAATFFRLHKP